jgi:hypothetical protein
MGDFIISEGITYIACPNNCHSGMVKHSPEKDKAFYVMVKCQFCKGEGIIKQSDKQSIESLIDNYDIYKDVIIFPNLK